MYAFCTILEMFLIWKMDLRVRVFIYIHTLLFLQDIVAQIFLAF